MRLILLVVLITLAAQSHAQITSEATGVQTAALQHNFEDFMSFSYSHGQLCQKALKQSIPGVRGTPMDLDMDLNLAGVMTSRWKQDAVQPDGQASKVWNFECVSQLRAGRKLVVVALGMYEERHGERRGVDLLTRRDIRITHNPQ